MHGKEIVELLKEIKEAITNKDISEDKESKLIEEIKKLYNNDNYLLEELNKVILQVARLELVAEEFKEYKEKHE